MITASELVFGQIPELAEYKHPKIKLSTLSEPCIACGRIDAPGYMAKNVSQLVSNSNNDFHIYGNGRSICQYCYSAHAPLAMIRLTNVLVTRSKVYSFQRWEIKEKNKDKEVVPSWVEIVKEPQAQIDLLLSPPVSAGEPFVFAFKDKMQTQAAHIIWKARVGFSAKRYPVQVGDRQILLSPDEIQDSIERMKSIFLDSKMPKHMSPYHLWSASFDEMEGHLGKKEPSKFKQWVAMRNELNPDLRLLFSNVNALRTAFKNAVLPEAE